MDYAEGTYGFPGDAPLYSGTQLATPILVAMGVAQAGVVVAAAVSGEYAVLALLAFFIPVELLFFRLTVTVDRQYVRAVFGVGLIRRRVPVGTIVSTHPMRNSPLMGWGIRYCGRRMLALQRLGPGRRGDATGGRPAGAVRDRRPAGAERRHPVGARAGLTVSETPRVADASLDGLS